MFETVVLATDGSESADRAVTLAFDFAERFDAAIHALYVVDETEVETSPERIRGELHAALEERGEQSLAEIESQGTDVTTAVREGDPASEICAYAEGVDADLIVTGTRGRHGAHAFLLGSVAEAVVRRSPVPVLTARQLDPDERRDIPAPGEMGA